MKKNAFTLIELLIVMAIIGILVSMIGGNYVSIKKKGRDAERKHDLAQIQSALEMYFNDHGQYPATGAVPFGSPWQDPTSGNLYMKQVSQDPRNGRDAIYSYEAVDANGTAYRLYAGLENDQDSDYHAYSGTDCCDISSCACTYAVSSPNIQLE